MNQTLNKKRTKRKYTKWDITRVYELFKKNLLQCLEEKYINTSTPMNYLCHCGYKGKIRVNHLKRGIGCRRCGDKKTKNKLMYSYETVKKYYKSRNCVLLSKSYKGAAYDLLYLCPIGHYMKRTYNSFQSYGVCSKCTGRYTDTFNEVKENFNNRKYIVLSGENEYKDGNSYISYKCPGGHFGKIKYNKFKQQQGCAKCSQSRSEKLTRDIFEKIMSAKFPTIRPDFLKNPETGCNLELDGYNEGLKLAFEYNGEQHYKFKSRFHMTEDAFKIQRERDEFKYKKCVELGITLISIPYTFNCYNPEKLENFIKDELIKHEFIFFL